VGGCVLASAGLGGCRLVVKQTTNRTDTKKWRGCFSILVVAADPAFFNNNQRLKWQLAFLFQPAVWIAGGLWAFPQAD
jgi:hypothetical protein